jgi:hypothetical protein
VSVPNGRTPDSEILRDELARTGAVCGHVILMDGTEPRLISACPTAESSVWRSAPADPHDLPIHEASEMGMLVALLRSARRPVRFSLCGEVELELIREGDDTQPVCL